MNSLGNAQICRRSMSNGTAGEWDVYAATDGVPIGAGSVATLNFGHQRHSDDGDAGWQRRQPCRRRRRAPRLRSCHPRLAAVPPSSVPRFSVNTLNQDGYTSGRLAGFNIRRRTAMILGVIQTASRRFWARWFLANFSPTPMACSTGPTTCGPRAATSGNPAGGHAPTRAAWGVLQSSGGGRLQRRPDRRAGQHMITALPRSGVYQANAPTIKPRDAVMQTPGQLR